MSDPESIPPPQTSQAPPTSMPVAPGSAPRAARSSSGRSLGSRMPAGAKRSRFAALAALAVVAVAAAILLVGPGGSDSGAPFSPIASAAERMQSYPGFRMNMTAKLDVPAAGQSVAMSGSGLYNGRTDQAELTVGTSGMPGGDFEIKEITDGSVFYLSSPQLSQQLGGASWMKLDLSDELPGSSGISGVDPTEQFAQLEAVSSDVRAVASEKVDGVITTHYAATLDARRTADLLREAGDDEGAAQLETLADQGQGSTPVDVWIDRKGLMRRFDMVVPFASPDGTSATMSMSMTMDRFGVSPEITIPSGAEVFDATELADQALGELSG